MPHINERFDMTTLHSADERTGMHVASSFAEQIGQFVAAEHELDVTNEEWMRLLHLDYAAVVFGGANRSSALAVRHAVETSSERGRWTPSSVVAGKGRPSFASAESAALVNGTIAHGLELDDTFEEGSIHPAVVIFPALFAVAEEEDISYRRLLVAAAVGYEVMCRVAVLLGAAESYGRGFHPTGVSGAIGAAAAVANLLGLSVGESTNAVAISANITAGSLEFLSDGSWTKRLNAGNAAAQGIRAARLAQAGFDAPDSAIEGTNGFLKQYGHGEQQRTLKLEFGTAARETSIKFYPCCRYMHGNIDLLRQIHAEYPDLNPDEICRIDAAVISAGAGLVSEPAERKLHVNTAVDAQFNMPFGAALAIHTGQASVADFDDAPVVAQRYANTMAKVQCYTDERIEENYPAVWQSRVKVVMNDGTEIERFEDAFVGSASKRASLEQIVENARGLIGEGCAHEMAEYVRGLCLDSPAALGPSALGVPSTS